MKKLGISVYPGHASLEENLNYIELAAKYGFSRIFTCLISVQGKALEDTVREFKCITEMANNHNMEVIADVDHTVFQRYGISKDDLSFFNDLGVHGIRLDMGFSGIEESIMSFNPYGLKIELNMSNGSKYIENVISYKPNKENIIGCHNFYPRLYTGLGLEHFIKCSRQFKELGIRTAAFVSSNEATFAQWPVCEGLCTLEMHRNLPIEVQAKHLYATELIDDVIIANAFASEKELVKLGTVNTDMLELKVYLVPEASEVERKIVLNETHFYRGDVSDYVIRSTQPRVKYKGNEFPAYNTPDIKRGDILIDSTLYTRYAGELQIALRDIKNTGKTNVVGRIAEEELFLIDYIEPWGKFRFIE
jgi:uncharacterized protein